MTDTLIADLKRNSLDDGPGIRTTVFFKGCPLSCVWCQNPETKSAAQQLVYEAGKCVGCHVCMGACTNGAIQISSDGVYPVDREKCRLCGQCVRACASQALHFAGAEYSVEELCRKLLRDEVFFKNSNGGVTFSGGEATLHMDYASLLAQKLKEHEIHLCLETCGFYDRKRFEMELLPYLDLVFFDIKIIDREKHKKYCGVYNDRILENFEELFRSEKVKAVPRIPLIPGITDDNENLEGIRAFFANCGVKEIGLLPYNPLWLPKSNSIGLEPEYSYHEWLGKEDCDRIKEIFKDFSFRDF